ncbi:MAG TPA: hypothetical protein IAA80_05980 [Candidatus Gallacutalibacter pullistercoris]|nr:hypothetical protein [Candidatus Gallacutalibacter pullistercoris]
MKQCPFCGTSWDGQGPCPSCGIASDSPSGDDSLFRRPENEESPSSSEPEKDFPVEELLQWSAPPQPEPEKETPKSSPVNEEETEENTPTAPKKLKLWQKIAAGVVVLVLIITAAIQLWPRSVSLPEEPAFFVQDGMMMALPAGGEPRQIAPYTFDIENYLKVSPDQKNFAWIEPETRMLKLQPSQGETFSFGKTPIWFYEFSQDGKYLYYQAAEAEGETFALYQYNLETKEEKQIGSVGMGQRILENENLLVTNSDFEFVIYDPHTLTELGSESTDVIPLLLSEDRLYYFKGKDENRSLCKWQDGKSEVVLDNIFNCYILENGTAYFVCYRGAPVPVTDLIQNDLPGEEGEEMLRQMEGVTVPPVQHTVYYFDGSEFHHMGDDLDFSVQAMEKDQAALLSRLQYPTMEETREKLSLSSLRTILDGMEPGGIEYVGIYARIYASGSYYPSAKEPAFVAVQEKLYPLSENTLEYPKLFQRAGDWVCAYNTGSDASKSGLWLGKLEEDAVVSQSFIQATDVTKFYLTPQGRLYYSLGSYLGKLYENGKVIAQNMNTGQIQFTEDGTLYFLSDFSGGGWTLNRVLDGKMEKVAENVANFSAYTRDYVLFVKVRQDNGYDLFSCTGEKPPKLAAEKIDKFLYSGKNDSNYVGD